MKALTHINLPGVGRFAPGQMISKAQLKEANQTDEDVKALVDGGSLSEDPNAPVHPDHAPITIVYTGAPHELDPVSGDFGYGGDVSV